jgi:pimeloyl-ACP methyl ester carboxylesterase
MHYLITLVHGTFARRAKWIQRDSLLCVEIERLLSDQVTFHPFVWSGRNSPRARSKAAARLNEYILLSRAAHPNAEQYVIGHSHGGNVALLAPQDPELREIIKGVVCLSTPFVRVSNRGLGEGRIKALFGMSGPVLSAAVLTAIGWWLNIIWKGPMWRSLLPGLGVFGVLSCAIWWLMVGTAQKLVEQVKSEAGPAESPIERLLIVRADGDEASAALSTSQFFLWLSSVLFRPVALVFRAFDEDRLNVPGPSRLQYLKRNLVFGLGFVLPVSVLAVTGLLWT